MKHFLFVLVGLLALLTSSCGGFSSTETPINGELTVFTAKSNLSKDTLLGVKNTRGEVVVTPASYKVIEADKNLIFCIKHNETIAVYRYDGTECGIYESFVQYNKNGNIFYVASSGDTTTYYFSDANKIDCLQSYMAKENLFIKKDSIWEIYDYTGKKLCNMPQGSIAIESIQTGEVIIAVAGKERRPTCTLYSTEGKKIQSLPAVRWKALLKLLKEPAEIGTLRVYSIVPPSYIKLTKTPAKLTYKDLHQLNQDIYTRYKLMYYA